MKIVLQKVKRSSVEIKGKIVGEIADGYLLFLAIHKNDTEKDANALIEKVLKLRLFSSQMSKSFMEQNIVEYGGGILVVSQFTLYGDSTKGTRPSFSDSAPAEKAEELYEYFLAKIREKCDLHLEHGEFGAHMDVEIINNGPITLILESNNSIFSPVE